MLLEMYKSETVYEIDDHVFYSFETSEFYVMHNIY